MPPSEHIAADGKEYPRRIVCLTNETTKTLYLLGEQDRIVRNLGLRLGNWLTVEQSLALWQAQDCEKLKGKRDRALLALLLACGLRRHEAVALRLEHMEQREEHWAIVDLKGKAGHVRTVPVPGWVMEELRVWLNASGIGRGKIFRRVTKIRRILGEGMTEKAVWHIVKDSAKRIGLEKLAPHDLRRYAEVGIIVAPAPASSTLQEESWNRFSFCWAMFPFRRRNATSAVSSGFDRRSMIRSESNPLIKVMAIPEGSCTGKD